AGILAECRRWEQQHAAPLAALIEPHRNPPDPDRRLRLGYVSPDFCRHSVANFMEPLFEAHDRQRFELFCYAEVKSPDETTRRFQDLADHWRSTVGESDRAIAEQVRRDGVDILVDLAGHTAKARLLVFAQKPAPVQVTWIGFLGTTGLGTMDYIIATRALIPEASRRHYVERVCDVWVYAPFRPPVAVPAESPAPALARGHVTLGCFNNAYKLSDAAVATWCRILAEVPTARLVLKSKSFADADIADAFRPRFAAPRARPPPPPPRRPSPYQEYLASYAELDLALDPFPANGGTTTRDILRVGVPLVTLRGDTMPGRVGAATLAAIGLGELVAATSDEYAAIAVRLASEPARLAWLRREVRRRMEASEMSDTVAATRRIEAAFRDMWRRWCGSGAAPTT